MNSASDWPDCSTLSKAALLTQLEASQKDLLAAIRQNTDELLEEQVPSTYKYTRGDLTIGILQHDIYHLGQINLLVSLLAEPTK
ncbi:MAG: DinB family protein [Bacteroidota bacterium]